MAVSVSCSDRQRDCVRQLGVLRSFLDVVAHTAFSRALQVYALHLRAALEVDDSVSRLSVQELATALGAPDITIKDAHRRLVRQGLITRVKSGSRITETRLALLRSGSSDGAVRPNASGSVLPCIGNAQLPRYRPVSRVDE